MRYLVLLLPLALFAGQDRYARLGDFSGKVEVQIHPADEWIAAERNLPLPESAWIRTGPASRVEIELDEGSVWRLGPNSQFGISDYSRLSTGQRVTLLSLERGLAYFTGQPEGKDALALGVPGAQVTLSRGARLRLEVEQTWSQISVIEGSVRFSSPAAEIDLREHQTTRVEPANPARFFLYRDVTPNDLDGWSEERDKALESTVSAAHVLERYGLLDLDAAGEWILTADLGMVWKPKVASGWTPFQNGRWRWYEKLGYTWVSDDPWGWLPYHYGRWSRRENLVWVWAPSRTAIFKPGEVYWLRGAKLAGWGPLAPAEDWKPAPATVPQQFLNVHTTYATLAPEATVIDPAGFTARPKDPLLTASFVPALPSPMFLAARLDAARPLQRAGNARVNPVIEGTSVEGAPIRITSAPPPPPPQPAVIVVENPPADPQPPAVPVAYPVPVYTGIVLVNPPSHPDYSRRNPRNERSQSQAGSTSGKSSKQPEQKPQPTVPVSTRTGAPGRSTPASERIPNGGREKKFRSNGEQEMAAEVIRDIGGNNFSKALADLEMWTERYLESDYASDRLYYYVVAHNGLQHPAKVVETASQLVGQDLTQTFQDIRQSILLLYLTSLNVQKLQNPTRQQLATGTTAARALLEFVPVYFTPDNRPATTTVADWTKARTDLEATARSTIANLSGYRR